MSASPGLTLQHRELHINEVMEVGHFPNFLIRCCLICMKISCEIELRNKTKKDTILALSSDVFHKRWGSNLLPLLRSHQAAAEPVAHHTSLDQRPKHSPTGTITSGTRPRNTRSGRAVRAEAHLPLTANS